jgi:hypothetical protein
VLVRDEMMMCEAAWGAGCDHAKDDAEREADGDANDKETGE